MDTLTRCRDLLADVTPLPDDCGRRCGAACCASLPGEETGMLLFAGEAELYADKPGWTVRETGAGPMVVCPGTCRRGERPLACRLFPLLPVLRGEEVRVAMDARARVVCPLAASGPRGLQGAFVEAVRACGRLLAEDPAQRLVLESLTRAQDDLRALQQSFGGGDHV